MAYTGAEVFDMAIAVIDELSATGTINEADVREYRDRAPYLLNMWQHELKNVESIEALEKITDLEQELRVSDEGCISGVYYLAMHFALADQSDELAAFCQNKYYELRGIGRRPRQRHSITDVYGIVG